MSVTYNKLLLVFENCESVTIEMDGIEFILLGPSRKRVERQFTKDGLRMTNIISDFCIKLQKEADLKFHGHYRESTVFERLHLGHDITQIHLFGVFGETQSYYVGWEDDTNPNFDGNQFSFPLDDGIIFGSDLDQHFETVRYFQK